MTQDDELHGECGQEDFEEYMAAAWAEEMRGYDNWDDAVEDNPGLSLADQYPDEFDKVDIVEVGYAHYAGDLQVWDTMEFSYPRGSAPEDAAVLDRFYELIVFPVAHAWIHSREEA